MRDNGKLRLTGAIVLLAGLLVMLGWHAHILAFIKLHQSLTSMRYNTALCFVFLGAAFTLASYRQEKAATIIGAPSALISVLVITEYITGTNLGIDQLFMLDYLEPDLVWPGRMSLATACCFLMLYASMLLMLKPGRVLRINRAALAIFMLGLVIAQCLVVFVLYALGMMAAYKLIFYAGIALHTTILLFLLSTVQLHHALKLASDSRQWLSSMVIIAALSFSLVLWQAIRLQQEENLKQLMHNSALSLQNAVQQQLLNRAFSLRRMAQRWEAGTTHEQWMADSTQYLHDFGDVKSLLWLDEQGRSRWQAFSGSEREEGGAVPATLQALPSAEGVYWMRSPRHPGDYDLLVTLHKDGHAAGYLRMRLNADLLLRSLLSEQLALGYLLRIQDGTALLFSNHGLGVRGDGSFGTSRILPEAGWRLDIAPSVELATQQLGRISQLALFGGIVMGILLLIVAELFMRSRQQEMLVMDQNAQLQISELKYRYLLNELLDGVFVAQDYHFVFANRSLAAMLGYTPEEMISMPFNNIVAPQHLDVWEQRFAMRIAAADGHEPKRRYELQMLKRDGSLIWVELYARRTDYEERPAVIGIIRNREVEKALQQELDFNRERMDLIAAGAVDGIWDLNVITNELYLSPRYEALLGYAPGELARNFEEWKAALHPEDKEIAIHSLHQHLYRHGPYRLDYRLQMKDGSYRWFHASGQAKWDEQGQPVRMAGSLTDISQRKAQEAALLASEQRFRAMIESVRDYAIYLLDAEGNVLTWNTGAERNKGYTASEVLGKNFSIFFIPEDVQQELPQRELERARREGRVEDEGWRRRKDGTRFWASIVLTALTDADGNFRGFVKIVRDLTERRAQELQLKSALAEKENLLKEVYHRVKNNLQVIRSLLNLQSRGVTDQAAKNALADTASRVTAMAIVHEKLYRSGNLSAITLNEYIDDLLNHLKQSWGNLKQIELQQDIPAVEIDLDTAIPLGLLLNELISNSLKHAFPDGRRGLIEISLQLLDDGRAELRVQDNGVGLPENSDWRKSSSMGLKLADSLAGQLDGQLEIRSSGDVQGVLFIVHRIRLGRTTMFTAESKHARGK